MWFVIQSQQGEVYNYINNYYMLLKAVFSLVVKKMQCGVVWCASAFGSYIPFPFHLASSIMSACLLLLPTIWFFYIYTYISH